MIVPLFIWIYYSVITPLLGSIIVENATLTTANPIPNDDYYLSYDYDININITDIKSDSLIMLNRENTLPDVELPDDSLADPDLKDHNCIDNLMYVYYGGNGKNTKSYGGGVIIFGSVMCCAAQLLTLFCVLIKKCYKGRPIGMMLIVAHIFATMFLSNIIFMLGVFSTKNVDNCLLIAIIINIFHHHTALWIFLYCLYIYDKFSSSWVSAIFQNINWYILVTHVLPLLITLTTYYTVPKSFETKKFCFKSMHRGMILNFMIPVCILLILTTIYAIRTMIRIENLEVNKLDYHYQSESLQTLNNKEERKLKSFGNSDDKLSSLKRTISCLKSLCVIQLMFTLNWFITPFALDASNNGTELPYIQSMSSMILHWFIFYKRKSLIPPIDCVIETEPDKEVSDEEAPSSATEVISVASSDNIPLLKCDSGTELKEFCCNSEAKDAGSEYDICTITT